MYILEKIIFNLIKHKKLNIEEAEEKLAQIVQTEEHKMLIQIQEILKTYNPLSNENEDFRCIEEILEVFEAHDIGCGCCHDF